MKNKIPVDKTKQNVPKDNIKSETKDTIISPGSNVTEIMCIADFKIICPLLLINIISVV